MTGSLATISGAPAPPPATAAFLRLVPAVLPLLPLLVLLSVTTVLPGCRCLDPSHPRYAALVRCRDEARPTWPRGGPAADASMARCIKELLLAAGDRYRAGQGIPGLGIPRGDPLEIPFMRLDVPALSVSGNATDMVVVGQAESFSDENLTVEASARRRRARATFRAPEVRGRANFDQSVDIVKALFPPPGSYATSSTGGGDGDGDGPVIRGKLDGSFVGMTITMFLLFEESADPGKGLVVKNVGLKQKFDSARVNISPRFTGTETPAEKERQKTLIELINSVAENEDMRRTFMKEMVPTITGLYAKANYRLFSQGFDNIHLL